MHTRLYQQKSFTQILVGYLLFRHFSALLLIFASLFDILFGESEDHMTDTSVSAPQPVADSPAAFSTIGELLKKSWYMVTQSWKNLLMLSIVMWVVVAVLVIAVVAVAGSSIAISGGLESLTAGVIFTLVGVGLLALIAVFVFSSVLNTAMVVAVAEAEQKPSIGSLLNRGFKLFVPVFLTSLLIFFFVYGGMILLIIPGIVISILASLSIYEVIFTEHRYLDAIKNSVKIVSQNLGILITRSLVLGLLVAILAVLESILQELAGGDGSRGAALVGLVTAPIEMVITWFSLCYYYSVYTEVRRNTNFEKSTSIVWIWVVSILGWILSAFVIVAVLSSRSFIDAYNIFNNSDSSFQQIMRGEFDENDVDQVLEEYGQEISDEEKQTFRQLMGDTESAVQEDQEALQQESSSL